MQASQEKEATAAQQLKKAREENAERQSAETRRIQVGAWSMRACGCAQRRFACVVQEAERERASLVTMHAEVVKGLQEQVRGSRAGRLPGVRATQRTMVRRSRCKPRPTQISLRSTPFF